MEEKTSGNYNPQKELSKWVAGQMKDSNTVSDSLLLSLFRGCDPTLKSAIFESVISDQETIKLLRNAPEELLVALHNTLPEFDERTNQPSLGV